MKGFHFTRSARSPRALIFVTLWWLVLFVLYTALDASPVIVVILACASLPALYDIYTGGTAELRIDEKNIHWRSGRRLGQLALTELKLMRFDTKLDMSVRLTLLTHHGAKVRLPYECVPAGAEIEPYLTENGIPFEKHHFALMS